MTEDTSAEKTPEIIETPGGARIFADVSIQNQIAAIVAALPASHNAVAVDVGFDKYGVGLYAAVRLKPGWSLVGMVGRSNSDGSFSGRVGLRWSDEVK